MSYDTCRTSIFRKKDILVGEKDAFNRVIQTTKQNEIETLQLNDKIIKIRNLLDETLVNWQLQRKRSVKLNTWQENYLKRHWEREKDWQK